MNREDFYFKQPVTESELDSAFDYCEQADNSMMTDQALSGIFQGGEATQHTGTPNVSIDLSGPCFGYDQAGRRLYFGGPSLNVPLANDSNGSPTTVAGGGNEKWVSVFLKFARALSDSRTDGNAQVVLFHRDEAHEIIIVQGAEAAIGVAVKPTLDPDMILLCDVNRTNGQTQIFDADISITRRQDTFAISGSPTSIRAGTPLGAVTAMLTELNNHIANLSNPHAASSISYGGFTGSDAFSTVAPGGDVEAAIDFILDKIDYLHTNTPFTRDYAKHVSLIAGNTDTAAHWTYVFGSWVMGSLGVGKLRFDLDVPANATITNLIFFVQGSSVAFGGASHSAAPVTPMQLTLESFDPNAALALPTVIATVTDTTAYPAYDAHHAVTLSGLSTVVDDNIRYMAGVKQEASTNSVANSTAIMGIVVVWTAAPP